MKSEVEITLSLLKAHHSLVFKNARLPRMNATFLNTVVVIFPWSIDGKLSGCEELNVEESVE